MMTGRKWAAVAAVALIGCGASAWRLSPPGGGSARGDEKTGKEAKAEVGARPPYVHSVVFYLKEGAPKGEAESIIADAHALLAKIPSVKGLWIGRPAEKGTPELAVTDYHVA